MANSDEFNKGADWMLDSLTSEQAEAHVEAAIRDALGDPRHPNIDNLNEVRTGEMDVNGSFSIAIIAQAVVMALYDAKTSGEL